jgi:hypothetical protein
MTIEIAGYKFAGVYSSTSSLEDRSGVYAILTPTDATHYKVIDVGESATVKSRVEDHSRKPCWRRNANSGGLRYAVHYTPRLQQAGRRVIEQEVRQKYRPPCGSQ